MVIREYNMFKFVLLAALFAVSLAKPGGLGGYGYGGHGGYGGLGGAAYGAGAHGGFLVPSSGVSTSSRADVFGPAVAYSAGAPYHGAITLPRGINAGYAHASRVAIAAPFYGAIGGYGGHYYGGHH